MEKFKITTENKIEGQKNIEIIERKENGVEILTRLIKSGKIPEELSFLDEEVLIWLAITYEHPEREDAIFELIKKHKEHIDIPKIYQEKIFSLMISDKENEKIETNEFSKKDLNKLKNGIHKTISYFRLNPLSISNKKIIAVEADNYIEKQSGYGIPLKDEFLIFSHSENPDGFNHEFMHSFINPIIEKLTNVLSEEQKRTVVEMSDIKYKDSYGDDWFSLLSEEIIRVYNNFIRQEGIPIKSSSNKLRSLVTDLYTEYEMEMNKNSNLSFEDFLIKTLPEKIK